MFMYFILGEKTVFGMYAIRFKFKIGSMHVTKRRIQMDHPIFIYSKHQFGHPSLRKAAVDFIVGYKMTGKFGTDGMCRHIGCRLCKYIKFLCIYFNSNKYEQKDK